MRIAAESVPASVRKISPAFAALLSGYSNHSKNKLNESPRWYGNSASAPASSSTTWEWRQIQQLGRMWRENKFIVVIWCVNTVLSRSTWNKPCGLTMRMVACPTKSAFLIAASSRKEYFTKCRYRVTKKSFGQKANFNFHWLLVTQSRRKIQPMTEHCWPSSVVGDWPLSGSVLTRCYILTLLDS